MTSIDITFGDGIENRQFDLPVIKLIDIESQKLNVIKGFLLGTESNEWLIKAENNVYNKLKNG